MTGRADLTEDSTIAYELVKSGQQMLESRGIGLPVSKLIYTVDDDHLVMDNEAAYISRITNSDGDKFTLSESYEMDDLQENSSNTNARLYRVVSGAGTDYNETHIYFNSATPPSGVIIYGAIKQPYLEEDEDTNFWSERYPMLLATAAAMYHEMTLRNTEGVRDWNSGVEHMLQDIDRSSALHNMYCEWRR